MGINLRPLLHPEDISLEDLSHKVIAIDAYNILYQFLSIIRQRDGTPLKDAQGRVTSHLAGLLYRTANLIERDVKPVYVFDGTPHPLKLATLLSRREIKKKARDAWRQALEQGDMEEARKYAQQMSTLTNEQAQEAQILLDGLGIPYIQAPGEGEAQASYMSQHVAVDYAGSQDFDSLLFGAPVLVRNITTTGRRKIPGKQQWMSISPERIQLNDVLSTHGITREQLVEMALLMGTDFNEGIRGIGPKTALKLIKKHGCIEDVVATGKIEKIPQLDELRRIFLEPSVTQEYQLIWKPTDDQAVVDFLSREHQFDEGRVRSALEKFKNRDDGGRQKGLFDF